ncbi:MAG: hypothetical protein A3B70_04425 [Deltaproteobacteria bacterium RIFCSPHIGHO2_02_FULL_40_11]|nr:MAG: hypothetical protein A3B70_04425 [Deltaproteobacteria bacterium RIFCSPHIGHO2_02_FULL_40_11]
MWKKIRNNKGQALTEFLFVFVLLLFIVMAHFQLSLTYVTAHIMKYATFMAARSESSTPATAGQYIEDMVGTETQSKLSFIATPKAPQNGYVQLDSILLNYDVLSYIPLFGNADAARLGGQSTSPLYRQPLPLQPDQGVFDNE